MTTYSYDIESAYIFHESALQAFKPIYVYYNANTKKFNLTAKIGGKEMTLEGLESLPLAYKSEDAYRKGLSIPTMNIGCYANLIEPCQSGDNIVYFIDSKGGLETCDSGECNILCDYIKKKSILCHAPSADADENTKFYTNRNDLMLCEDVRIVDEQGGETLSKSFFNKIALDKEQQAAWDEFMAAAEKLKDLKVNFIEDADTNWVYPISEKEMALSWSNNATKVNPQLFENLVEGIYFERGIIYSCLEDADELTFAPCE